MPSYPPVTPGSAGPVSKPRSMWSWCVVYLSFVVCIFHSGKFSLPRPQKLLSKLIIHPLYIFSRNPTNLLLLIEKKLHDIFLHAYYLVFSFKKSIKIPHTALCNGTRACRAAYKNVLHVLSSKKGWLSFIKPVVSLDVLKEFQTWNELLICVFGVFCTSLSKGTRTIWARTKN